MMKMMMKRMTKGRGASSSSASSKAGVRERMTKGCVASSSSSSSASSKEGFGGVACSPSAGVGKCGEIWVPGWSWWGGCGALSHSTSESSGRVCAS